MRDCDKCKKRETCDDFKKDLADKTKTLFGCSEFEPMGMCSPYDWSLDKAEPYMEGDEND